MFLITAQFRAARSKRDGGKPGVVFYRITGERPAGGGAKPDRKVNSSIKGRDESVLRAERDTIVAELRLLYSVIERLEITGRPYTIDDVAEGFRVVLSEASTKAMPQINEEIPLRSDLVTVGREFRRDFRFVAADYEADKGHNPADYVRNLVVSLKRQNRVSRARGYSATMSSIAEYTRGRALTFADFNADFIRNYAEWLSTTGVSTSTRGFYLRTIRAILSHAHADGMTVDPAPMFKDIDLRSNSESKPVIIDRATVNRLKEAGFNGDDALRLGLVRDMFMFGFYCRGMELVDIANLTHADIRGDILTYRRRLKGRVITVRLGHQAKTIIERYRCKDRQHLFPLLDEAGDVMFATVRNEVGRLMKVIGKAVGWPSLTFSMNIDAYKSLMSGISIPEILLKYDDVI